MTPQSVSPVILDDVAYNNYVVTMIPPFVSIVGAPWAVLPPGIHHATIREAEIALAFNARRREIFSGFLLATTALYDAGCSRVYLDGSFVTAKPIPGDFDACWDSSGVNPARLDPVLLNFEPGRKSQKAKFQGEFFPAHVPNAPGQTFVDFFQVEKYSGQAKGIISFDLSLDPQWMGRLR